MNLVQDPIQRNRITCECNEDDFLRIVNMKAPLEFQFLLYLLLSASVFPCSLLLPPLHSFSITHFSPSPSTLLSPSPKLVPPFSSLLPPPSSLFHHHSSLRRANKYVNQLCTCRTSLFRFPNAEGYPYFPVTYPRMT